MTGLGTVFYGSANLSFFSQALVLPLCNFLFSSRVIMGDSASKITVYDVLGVLIISIGVTVYTLPFKVRWPWSRKEAKVEGESLLQSQL